MVAASSGAVETDATTASMSRGLYYLLGALMATGPLSVDLYLAAFPRIAHDLGVSSASVQWTLASYFAGMTLGQGLYGSVSDRFGRKPPLYVGVSLYTLASLGCFFATNIEQMVVLRFLQGLGGASGLIIARAIVRDMCTPHETARVLSKLMLVMGISPILAPILGGWLLLIGSWRLSFTLMLLLGAGALLGLYFYLRETLQIDKRSHQLSVRSVLDDYRTLLKDQSFIRYALAMALPQGAFYAYIVASSHVLMQVYGFSPQRYSFTFGAIAGGYVFTAQLNARLLRHYSLHTVLYHANHIIAVSGIFLWIAALIGRLPIAVLLAGLFVYISALGAATPNASAAALAHQGHRAGRASSLLGVLQFGAGTVAGGIASFFQSDSAVSLITVMASCGICSWLILRGTKA